MMLPMQKGTLIVSGLGRCGSSLLMQMLAAGGLRCAGKFPDFEQEGMAPGDYIGAIWVHRFEAVKILTPDLFVIERNLKAGVVWLDRSAGEQARSHIKLLEAAGQSTAARRSSEAHWRQSLGRLRDSSMAALAEYPMLMTSFERLLVRPAQTCASIATFALRFGLEVDPLAMATAVIPRATACAPDMAIEKSLLEKATHAH